MSGLQGSKSWVRAGVTSAAALALCACGGSRYRSEHAPERAAETCSAAETVTACEQRLQGYASQLDALVGPVASAATPAASPPAPVQNLQAPPAAPDVEAPAELQSAPAPEAASEADEENEAEGPAPPDCDAARDLRDRICELAAAICELAARSDSAPETKTTCGSSQTSCARARSRVATACPG